MDKYFWFSGGQCQMFEREAGDLSSEICDYIYRVGAEKKEKRRYLGS